MLDYLGQLQQQDPLAIVGASMCSRPDQLSCVQP